MKRKSLVTLCVTLLLVVLVGVLALNGAQVDKYRLKPVGQAISLGLDLRGGIYAVYLGDTTAENFDEQMDATVTIMRNRLTSAGYTEANTARSGDPLLHLRSIPS